MLRVLSNGIKAESVSISRRKTIVFFGAYLTLDGDLKMKCGTVM